MKSKEIQEKNSMELEKLLSENQAALVQLRFDVRAGQQKNCRKIQSTKKDIARIKSQLKNMDEKGEDKPNNEQDND
jgi:ribosomal protein L29